MSRFAAAGLLLALAAGLPGVAAADDGGRKYYYEDILEPFFTPDPARPGWYRANRPNAKKGSFRKDKPAGGFRVFVLGGSIAGLLQYDGGPGDLGPALRAALPGREVEVLNCGMAGYETRREALIEQEILAYQPDLIVMLTGHNEGLASGPIPLWIMRAQDRLARFETYRTWVKRLRGVEQVGRHSNERADARDADFARQLGENLRRARVAGVPVAVVVPPRNYREPSELGRTPHEAEFVPGWIKFLRRDWRGAREFWRAAVARESPREYDAPSRKAFLWGLIARAEEKLELWKEARDSFEEAARHDRAPLCGPICQGILRSVSAEEGAFLVEADRRFRALAAPRMPGLDYFNDRMHWKPRYNCHVSAEIIAAARARPGLSELPWDAAAIDRLNAACDKRGGRGEEGDDERMLGYVLLGLSELSQTRLSTVSVFSLEVLRRNRPAWFKDVTELVGRTVNPQVLYGVEPAPAAPLVPRFLWHIAVARMLDKDYAGAAADLRRALELEPALSWARIDLAAAEALSGERKAAAARFAEVLARATDDQRRVVSDSALAVAAELGLGDGLTSSDPEHLLSLVDAALAKGRKAEAAEALKKVRVDGLEPALMQRLGQSYLRLRDAEGFLAVADRLAAHFPDDVGFAVGKAESLFVTGRRAEGVAALERAEALKPGPDYRRVIAAWRAWLADGAGPDKAPR